MKILPFMTTAEKNIPYIINYSAPNTAKRKIVIEEFTGHTCGNCPDGAREIKKIDSIYKPQIIPISIHAGVFAKPKNPPATKYLTDFRTPEGTEYNNTFLGQSGFYPSAMVSRVVVNGSKILQKADWETTVNTIKNDAPKASIEITNWYNDSLRCLKTKTKIKWLSTASGNYKLQILLIEDHIKDWQLDGTVDIPDYDHRHVLRKSLNGIWGSEISTSNANDTAAFEFYLNLDAKWKPSDCEIVSFIYNSSTYEVIQASEAKISDP